EITTGCGTRPIYFLRTALVLWLVDAALFFANDYFNPGLVASAHFCAQSQPHIQRWTNALATLLHYLYLAITTLTSLGSDSSLAAYCGGTFAQALLSLSTVCGYFMLGLLSALLYTQLTQRN
ncbi:MAG TPA: hypothetical protein VGN32_06835, partial [Ktedonobacterales bacterium]|nr:hypothetical protein [Ktedonobacterales bacterium]